MTHAIKHALIRSNDIKQHIANLMKEILEKTYYDVSDLAKMLGLTDVTIRRHFKSGKIKGKKIGKEWHASESAVKEFIGDDDEPDGYGIY